ncbi:hypothetical protein N7454_007354 [Penicillium verhagenii]|nr:hypothetical protein N7454_007354 [Penicillium verhagenii]
MADAEVKDELLVNLTLDQTIIPVMTLKETVCFIPLRSPLMNECRRFWGDKGTTYYHAYEIAIAMHKIAPMDLMKTNDGCLVRTALSQDLQNQSFMSPCPGVSSWPGVMTRLANLLSFDIYIPILVEGDYIMVKGYLKCIMPAADNIGHKLDQDWQDSLEVAEVAEAAEVAEVVEVVEVAEVAEVAEVIKVVASLIVVDVVE